MRQQPAIAIVFPAAACYCNLFLQFANSVCYIHRRLQIPPNKRRRLQIIPYICLFYANKKQLIHGLQCMVCGVWCGLVLLGTWLWDVRVATAWFNGMVVFDHVRLGKFSGSSPRKHRFKVHRGLQEWWSRRATRPHPPPSKQWWRAGRVARPDPTRPTPSYG